MHTLPAKGQEVVNDPIFGGPSGGREKGFTGTSGLSIVCVYLFITVELHIKDLPRKGQPSKKGYSCRTFSHCIFKLPREGQKKSAH